MIPDEDYIRQELRLRKKSRKARRRLVRGILRREKAQQGAFARRVRTWTAYQELSAQMGGFLRGMLDQPSIGRQLFPLLPLTQLETQLVKD